MHSTGPRKEPPTLLTRGTSLSPISPQSPRSHSPKLLPFNPSRRHIYRINLEQRIQDHGHEQTHHSGTDNLDPKGGPGEEQPHSMKNKHQSRLPEPPARRQKLSPEPSCIPGDLHQAQFTRSTTSFQHCAHLPCFHLPVSVSHRKVSDRKSVV